MVTQPSAQYRITTLLRLAQVAYRNEAVNVAAQVELDEVPRLDGGFVACHRGEVAHGVVDGHAGGEGDALLDLLALLVGLVEGVLEALLQEVEIHAV